MIARMEILRRQYKQYKIRLNANMHRFTGNNTKNLSKASNYTSVLRKRTSGLFGKPLLAGGRNSGYSYNNNN